MKFLIYKLLLGAVLLLSVSVGFGFVRSRLVQAAGGPVCQGCNNCGGCAPQCGHAYACVGCITSSCEILTSSNPACACAPPPDPCAGNTNCGQCGNPACCSPNCSGYQCGQANGCGGNCGAGDALTGCSPACGQTSVCGNACGNASAGTPGPITVISPPNGGTVQPTGGQVTIDWANATLATRYDFHLYPSDNPVCSDPRAYCTDVASGGGLVNSTYTFTPQANQYDFTIRAVNQNCNSQNGGAPWYGNWVAPDNNFDITANITGRVFNDPSSQAAVVGSLCTLGGSPTGTQAGTGSNVVVTDDSGTRPGVNVAANGTYTATALFNGAATVDFNPGDPNYVCSCPTGCTYGGILSPTANVNFYVTQVGNHWFQVLGGDINASDVSSAIADPISTLCTTPSCQPYLLLPTTGGTNAQVGALLTPTTAGVNVDVSSQAGFQQTPVGPTGASRSVKTNSSLACRENYNYFFRLYSMGVVGTPQAPKEDFVAPANNPADAQKPSVPSLNASGAYYHEGDMTISSTWTLSGSESFVIFVNGDLTFNNSAQVIMPSGTFISFIVSGNIIVDPTVGSTDPASTTGTLQGVYIANGTLTVQTQGATPANDEKKFIGEGTFAACGDIALLRDFRNSVNSIYGVNNNRYPASLFVFRPDVMTSAPEKMKRPLMNWREVAP